MVRKHSYDRQGEDKQIREKEQQRSLQGKDLSEMLFQPLSWPRATTGQKVQDHTFLSQASQSSTTDTIKWMTGGIIVVLFPEDVHSGLMATRMIFMERALQVNNPGTTCRPCPRVTNKITMNPTELQSLLYKKIISLWPPGESYGLVILNPSHSVAWALQTVYSSTRVGLCNRYHPLHQNVVTLLFNMQIDYLRLCLIQIIRISSFSFLGLPLPRIVNESNVYSNQRGYSNFQTPSKVRTRESNLSKVPVFICYGFCHCHIDLCQE